MAELFITINRGRVVPDYNRNGICCWDAAVPRSEKTSYTVYRRRRKKDNGVVAWGWKEEEEKRDVAWGIIREMNVTFRNLS